MFTRTLTALTVGLFVTAAGAEHMVAQDPPPADEERMQEMQEMMERMRRMMDRMEEARERGHRFDREMREHMERMREEHPGEHRMMLDHERMRGMARELGMLAGNLERAADRMMEMLRDEGAFEDPGMREEVERMLERMEGMADRVEEGIEAMERMRERMRDRMHRPGPRR